MDFSNPSKSAGDLLGGLKDKLGFKGAGNADAYADEDYYDEYEEYAPDEYDFYDDVYSDRLDYTTRDTGRYNGSTPALLTPREIRESARGLGAGRNAATGSGAAFAGETAPLDTLPDFDDADEEVLDPGYDDLATGPRDFASPFRGRNHTAGAASDAHTTGAFGAANAARDAFSGVAAGASNAISNAKTSLFSAVGSGVNATPAHTASADSATSTHSAGLNSLFSATTDVAAAEAGAAASIAASTPDPFDAFEGGQAFHHSPTRKLQVVKPASYEDVAAVARYVRAGDVVVLALRTTDASLAKRVLDFSFGVASALDAQVDCPSDKVFTIIKGNALTLEEQHRLRQQGVL